MGAAVQALWAYRKQQGQPVQIAELCDKYIALDETTRAKPEAEHVQRYQQMQVVHDQIVRDLGPAFTAHRRLIGA